MTLPLLDGTERTIRYISIGDQFGALMLVSDDEIPVDVVVDEAAVLLRLDKEIAVELTQRFPVFRRNLLGKVGVGVRDSLHWRRKRRMAKVVSFLVADEPSRKLVGEIASRLVQIGERVAILCDSGDPGHYDPAIPVHTIGERNGDRLSASEVDAIVGQLTDIQWILIVVDRLHSASNLRRILATSDQVFCLANSNDFSSAIEVLQQSSPTSRNKTHLVWLLNENSQVAPLVPELPDLVARDFKIQLPIHGNEFRKGIDRLLQVRHVKPLLLCFHICVGAA